jgi:hypothetical protein
MSNVLSDYFFLSILCLVVLVVSLVKYTPVSISTPQKDIFRAVFVKLERRLWRQLPSWRRPWNSRNSSDVILVWLVIGSLVNGAITKLSYILLIEGTRLPPPMQGRIQDSGEGEPGGTGLPHQCKGGSRTLGKGSRVELGYLTNARADPGLWGSRAGRNWVTSPMQWRIQEYGEAEPGGTGLPHQCKGGSRTLGKQSRAELGYLTNARADPGLWGRGAGQNWVTSPTWPMQRRSPRCREAREAREAGRFTLCKHMFQNEIVGLVLGRGFAWSLRVASRVVYWLVVSSILLIAQRPIEPTPTTAPHWTLSKSTTPPLLTGQNLKRIEPLTKHYITLSTDLRLKGIELTTKNYTTSTHWPINQRPRIEPTTKQTPTISCLDHLSGSFILARLFWNVSMFTLYWDATLTNDRLHQDIIEVRGGHTHHEFLEKSVVVLTAWLVHTSLIRLNWMLL